MAYSVQDMFDRTMTQEFYPWDKEGAKLFRTDCIDTLMSEYDLNEGQAKRIYDAAYTESHSSGYYEVMGTADEYADMVTDCMKLAFTPFAPKR